MLLSNRHALKQFVGCGKTVRWRCKPSKFMHAPSPTCQELRELRGQIAALTTKTGELQSALQQQSAPARRRNQSVVGEGSRATFNMTVELDRRLYEQQQQGQKHSTIQDRDQGGTGLYIPRRGRGPCFSSQQGN